MNKLKASYKKFQTFIKPYKQPLRAFIGWLFGLLAQVIPQGGYDEAMTWGWKKWAFTLVVAALPGIMGFMRGGDSNPSDEELYEKVHAVKQARVVQGLEVTGESPLAAPPKP